MGRLPEKGWTPAFLQKNTFPEISGENSPPLLGYKFNPQNPSRFPAETFTKIRGAGTAMKKRNIISNRMRRHTKSAL